MPPIRAESGHSVPVLSTSVVGTVLQGSNLNVMSNSVLSSPNIGLSSSSLANKELCSSPPPALFSSIRIDSSISADLFSIVTTGLQESPLSVSSAHNITAPPSLQSDYDYLPPPLRPMNSNFSSSYNRPISDITSFSSPAVSSLPSGLVALYHRASRSPLSCQLTNWNLALRDFPDPAVASWVLSGLQHGFRLGLSSVGKIHSRRKNNIPTDLAPIADDWLRAELGLGRVVGPLSPDSLPWSPATSRVSPLGLVEKVGSNGKLKFRTTTNFTASGVNDCISDSTAAVSYPLVADIARLWNHLPASAAGVVVDVEAAFRQIPISPLDYPDLLFEWRGQLYLDTRLPFGIRSGPALYDAVGAVIQFILERACSRRVIRYLDDHGLAEANIARCTVFLSRFLAACAVLGLPISLDKLLSPAQLFKFLGLLWDLLHRHLSLPSSKWAKFNLAMSKVSASTICAVPDLQRLTGLLQHMTIVLHHGRAFIQRLFPAAYPPTPDPRQWRFMSRRLNAGMRADLAWWRSIEARAASFTRAFASFAPFVPQVIVHTDASTSGFGAWTSEGFWIAGAWPSGYSLTDAGTSTLFLEIAAVFMAVSTWSHLWRSKDILFRCDNLGVSQAWNSRSSHAEKPMEIIRSLVSLLIASGVGHFSITWLSTTENFIADTLSRLQNPSLPFPPELGQFSELHRRWQLPAFPSLPSGC